MARNTGDGKKQKFFKKLDMSEKKEKSQIMVFPRLQKKRKKTKLMAYWG